MLSLSVENYRAQDVLPFLKSSDMFNGKSLNLGNMSGGFPVEINRHIFYTAEAAYICASYGNNDSNSVHIQEEIQACKNGMSVKKIFRKQKSIAELARCDFNTSEWRFHWMFYIVWNKVCQNKNFRDILLNLPYDKILVENGNHTSTGHIWGCKNLELQRKWNKAYKNIEQNASYRTIKEFKELKDKFRCDLSEHIGVWTGQNIMGKILMECRDCLVNNKQPDIDYKELNDGGIYWFGEKLKF